MHDDTQRSGHRGRELADCMTGAEAWAKWEKEREIEKSRLRSVMIEKMLWRMLNCDKANEEQKKAMKLNKKVKQAMVKMRVGKTNPAL